MMFSRTLLALALYASTASPAPTNDKHSRPTAIIDTGAIIGTTTVLPSSTVTVNKFLGIPFAKPPVRFRAPEPVGRWPTLYDATRYGPACIENHDTSVDLIQGTSWNADVSSPPPAGESEDCLNLNVFAPASASAGSKAVLVWIFGGDFKSGSNSLPLYDGSGFAANQDVVVVTINYRTNVFGFPGSPDLPHGENNLALLDQRLGLQWVRRNIAGLGGNPFKITLFGQSAGAGSIDYLLTSPPGPLPFVGAIMQSGEGSFLDDTNSTKSWETLVEKAGCDPDENGLECIQSISAPELIEIVEKNGLLFRPMPDGGVTVGDDPLKDRMNSTGENSLIARVPIMIGSNSEESKYGVVAEVPDAREFLLESPDSPLKGQDELVDKILALYPLGAPGIATETDRVVAITTDFMMVCKIDLVSELSAKAGIDTWRYVFNASFPNTEIFDNSGAYHGAELPMVFGTYPEENATEFQADVSKSMQKAWADFAKDPSQGPGWKQVPEVGVFGGGVKVGMGDEGKKPFSTINSDLIDRGCGLWRQVAMGSS
ncbi:cholinesterase [Thelonectria olida]|uniref:Cholinesterase n=1 Tax=Thelonectria olida TaxID=1576542 RepID=A0A9P8WCK0_9HYPO|nr:cholinesterase [Thelonectria olida]